MQTSNKIIVSFLTFAWLSIIASLLISSRFATNRLYGFVDEVKVETTLLPDFSVINIEKAAFLRVTMGDSSQLKYTEAIGGTIKPPKEPAIREYEVRNDTLYIYHLKQASNASFSLEVSSLKHLIMTNSSNIELLGFKQDSLLISVIETASVGEINSLTVKNSSFSYLHFMSPQKFDLKIISANDLGVSLFGKNHFSVDGDIQEISGKIGNYMELNVPRKTEIVNVDTSENGKLTYSDPKEVDQEEQ